MPLPVFVMPAVVPVLAAFPDDGGMAFGATAPVVHGEGDWPVAGAGGCYRVRLPGLAAADGEHGVVTPVRVLVPGG